MADCVAEHIAALRDEDWGIREEAAVALGECRDPRGVRPLIHALRDEDRAVKTAATHALAAIGEPAVVELGHCLRDPDLSVQEAAASILSTTADERVCEPLTSALLSPDWVVRMHAARAMGRLGARRSADTLVLLLQDTVPAVRDEAVAVLTSIGEAAVAPLVDALGHDDWRIRLRAAEALCVLRSPTSVPALAGLVRHDPDTAVRQEAVRALGDAGHAGAGAGVGDILLEAMKEPRLRVRAIEALGKLGDRRVLPFLFQLLGALTPDAYHDRTPACEDNQSELELAAAEEAVRALARLRDESAIAVLMKALQSTLVRREAGDALVQFGRKAVAPLVKQLHREQDENIRGHIRDTLTGWDGTPTGFVWRSRLVEPGCHRGHAVRDERRGKPSTNKDVTHAERNTGRYRIRAGARGRLAAHAGHGHLSQGRAERGGPGHQRHARRLAGLQSGGGRHVGAGSRPPCGGAAGDIAPKRRGRGAGGGGDGAGTHGRRGG